MHYIINRIDFSLFPLSGLAFPVSGVRGKPYPDIKVAETAILLRLEKSP